MWSSRPEPGTAADQPSSLLTDHSDDIVEDDREIDMPPVLMPDIYAEGHATTIPDVSIVAESVPDSDESAGFNPYDTGVLQKRSGSKPPRT